MLPKIKIPNELRRSSKITKHIDNIVSFDSTITTFREVDDLDQDMLIALGLEALNYDVDLIVDTSSLAKYLTSYTRESEMNLAESLREQSKEYFEPIFDQLITEYLDDMHTYDRKHSVDHQTGENLWA